jgi:aspartyl-tRNA(Asn)/glutamyl-tRNA(Gln) amidotransferase subunit C
MSRIDEATVDKIAHLARLTFSEAEKPEIISDLNRILTFVDKLNEVNTDGLSPLIYLTEEQNRMRKDEVIQVISHKEALKNAPDKDSDYFRVPKVVNKK